MVNAYIIGQSHVMEKQYDTAMEAFQSYINIVKCTREERLPKSEKVLMTVGLNIDFTDSQIQRIRAIIEE